VVFYITIASEIIGNVSKHVNVSTLTSNLDIVTDFVVFSLVILDKGTVVSPELVVCGEEGQSWKLGHEALTADFRARFISHSMTNSTVNNAVLTETAVRCKYLYQLLSQSS